MLANSIEGELMRSHFKSLVRQFGGFDLSLAVEQDVINAIAGFTDEMLMAFYKGIEVL